MKDKLERCEADVESSRKANELSLLPLNSYTTERYVVIFFLKITAFACQYCCYSWMNFLSPHMGNVCLNSSFPFLLQEKLVLLIQSSHLYC